MLPLQYHASPFPRCLCPRLRLRLRLCLRLRLRLRLRLCLRLRVRLRLRRAVEAQREHEAPEGRAAEGGYLEVAAHDEAERRRLARAVRERRALEPRVARGEVTHLEARERDAYLPRVGGARVHKDRVG